MYHVYAEDGFESCHRKELPALRAARRGSKIRRNIIYSVVVPEHGYTGGGHGHEIARYRNGQELQVR